MDLDYLSKATDTVEAMQMLKEINIYWLFYMFKSFTEIV